jgi:MinD-like ATPase involved in chromosome partitioning or flagellar assembly
MPAVNRQYPVDLLVPDALNAEITLGGLKIPLTADNNDLLMMQARAEIAAHALTLGGASLPVTIMDNSDEEPFLDFRLCTAEGKMPVDEEVPAAVKKDAEARFARWQKDIRHHAPRLVPVAVASDRGTAESEGVFTEEMIERARMTRGPVSGAHAAVPAPTPTVVVHGDLMDEYEPVATRDEETGTIHIGQPEKADRFHMDTLMTYGADDDTAQMWWRGAVNRFGLKLRPSEDEIAWRAAVKTMNVPWEGMKRVAVVNERGGAGKTITAAMLAAAFHLGTSWPIAGFDNNESGGNWHKRTGLNTGHPYTSLDLAEFYVQSDGAITRSDLARMGQKHFTDNYTLFTAHRPFKRVAEGKRKPETVQMRAVDVSNVYKALEDHNMLCVSDSGNTLGAPNWERMVEEQNQLVVPVMTSADRDDGAVETLKVLDSYEGRFAQLAGNAIIAVSVWHKGDEKLAEEAVARWSPHVREVVVIPHDPNLTADLKFSSLKRKTQLAYMQLAAAVAKGIREDLA